MDFSRSPRFSSWVLAIVLHGALLLCVALAIEGREAKSDDPEAPDFRCSLTPKGPFIGFERAPDCFGRWPRTCAHRPFRGDVGGYERSTSEDARCTLCGSSWRDIQESLWD